MDSVQNGRTMKVEEYPLRDEGGRGGGGGGGQIGDKGKGKGPLVRER